MPLPELIFPHNYQIEMLDTAPPGAVRIPDAGEETESLAVRVIPEKGEAWAAKFARGYPEGEMISGIYAWPDGISFAAVASGYGYVVRADEPRSWVRLQPMPITDVRSMPELGLIILADFTHIYAYNRDKALWKSERLSWDGVTINNLASTHIFGVGWDATVDKEVEFAVDARTGEHTGGAKPWAKR